jgi:hypothetical protein
MTSVLSDDEEMTFSQYWPSLPLLHRHWLLVQTPAPEHSWPSDTQLATWLTRSPRHVKALSWLRNRPLKAPSWVTRTNPCLIKHMTTS